MIATKTGPQRVNSRLLRGIGASALAPIVTAAIQLGSVPLLLHFFGPLKYGEWVLLSAIPTYMTFSDLGFGSSSASEMTMLVAGDDRKGALETFQSAWLLVSGVSLAVLMTAITIVWWVPWQRMLQLADVSSKQAQWIVLVLAGWILAMQQWSILESGYRCDGHFALGSFCTAMQRFIEAAAATIIGIVSGSLLLMAASYLGLRLLGLIWYRSLLKRVSPWLQLGLKHADAGTIRRMLKPSLGFIAMPLASAANVQGSLLVVGAVLGPIAVTVFSTARTLTRVGVQITNTLANGTWPELSMAFGAGNLTLARKLHRHAYQASLILAILCAASLWLFGPPFYHAWVRRAVALDLSCFHALLLVSIATSFWFPSAMVQMSTNRHSSLASIYLATTLVSCVLGYFLTRRLGLFGAAVTPLLIDIVMCSIVVPRSLQQMKDTPRDFLRFVFGSTPYFVRPLLNYRPLR